jgi:hypothetical protein
MSGGVKYCEDREAGSRTEHEGHECGLFGEGLSDLMTLE